MTSTIRVKVLRPFRVRGDAFAPGAIVSLDPLDAHAALGRCELLEPTDGPVIKAAVESANRNVLAAERQLGGPWR